MYFVKCGIFGAMCCVPRVVNKTVYGITRNGGQDRKRVASTGTVRVACRALGSNVGTQKNAMGLRSSAQMSEFRNAMFINLNKRYLILNLIL